MLLQSKWSCSVNTGLICTGARLGYISLNIAVVLQPEYSCSTAQTLTGWLGEPESDSHDGWTLKAMIQTICEIYQSVLLKSGSWADSLCQHHLYYIYVLT